MSRLPPEARRLREALYDEDSDAIRGVPLNPGISESLFADLIVGCLFNYMKRAKKFEEHDRHIHQRLLGKKGIQSIRQSGKSWPFAAKHAEEALALQAEYQRHHQEFLAWERGMSRTLDPILCLWVLFKYLAKPVRGQGVEFYMQKYFPRILRIAGLKPLKAKSWKADNIQRWFRRKGGTKNANSIAVLLLSTDKRLIPYRPPVPAKYLATGPPDPELVLSLTGRALYSISLPRKATPTKDSRGGQHPPELR
jgi:hypothetical protein